VSGATRGLLNGKRDFSVLLAALPSLLAVAATWAVFWPAAHRGDLVHSAIWGLVLLVSFSGWGRMATRLLVPGEQLDWGLGAVVGMAVLLAIGGLLQVMRLMSATMVMALTLAGLGALAADRLGRRQALKTELERAVFRARQAPLMTLAIALLYLLALVVYVGNVATPVMGVFDDAEAYAVYPKALLGLGSLEEPFSLRRLCALGGQSLLQSFLLVGSAPSRLNGFDNGICPLAILGMVHGYARGRRAATLVGMLFVVAFTYPFHNLGSALSGTAFFLALFRILDGKTHGELTDGRRAILVGLLAAAAWTLRQNYLVAVLAFLGTTYGLRWFDERHGKRAVLRSLMLSLGALLLFLIPWSIVSQRSSGTFLFPLILGNGRADFGLLGKVSLADELQFFGFNAFWNKPVRSIAFFVLAGLCLDERRRDRTVHALMIGTSVGVVMLIHAFSASDDVQSLSRYYMGFEYACVLAITLKSLVRLEGDEKPMGVRSFISAALVTLGVGTQLWQTGEEIEAHHFESMLLVTAQVERPLPSALDPQDALYKRLQTSIPPGETFLEMLDEPFRLDFRRNRILICDLPAGAGPAPGWPVHQGADRYEQYFRSHGIRYLAFTIGDDSPEYTRAKWTAIARGKLHERNGRSRGTLLREMAVFYLDVFDAMEELAKRKKHLFHEGSIHVLDLDTPAPSLDI
jgi:hypothetical protein